MRKVILFGNGNYAESVYYHVQYGSSFEVAGFTVDSPYIGSGTLLGKPVVPFEEVERIFPPSAHTMLVALSFQRLNRLRAEKYRQAKEKGYELVTCVSPRASAWPGLAMGDNCVIAEQASIGPLAEIGSDVTIGPNVVIGHHASIGDHCFIASGAVILGNVRVGAYCLIGANATVKEGLTIGTDSLIGAGAVITQNIADKAVCLTPSAELLDRSSDELREWLTWPAAPAGRSEESFS